MNRRRRGPRKPIFTYPAGATLPPGWYVQWCGRTDWQPMDEASARVLQRTITASGDKVLRVGDDGTPATPLPPDPYAGERAKLLRAIEGAGTPRRTR